MKTTGCGFCYLHEAREHDERRRERERPEIEEVGKRAGLPVEVEIEHRYLYDEHPRRRNQSDGAGPQP